MPVAITEQELIDALQKAWHEVEDGRPEGAFTTEQLCDLMGLEETAVRKRIRQLFKAGLLEVSSVRDVRIDGSHCRKPTYRLKAVA